MHSKPRDFSDVDRAANPSLYADYLDTASQLEQFQNYKRQTFELLQLEAGQHVLDVGCGTGTDTKQLAEFVAPGGRVVGLDASATLLETARQSLAESQQQPFIEYQLGDAHHLEFEDETFDACRADRVFQHLAQPELALAEMRRVTKGHGHLTVTEPDYESVVIHPGEKSITRRILNHHCDRLSHGWIGRQLLAMFRQAGFQERRAIPVPILLTNYRIACQVLNFDMIIRDAIEDQAVEPGDAEAWRHNLQNASDEGVFFFGVTGYTILGKK